MVSTTHSPCSDYSEFDKLVDEFCERYRFDYVCYFLGTTQFSQLSSPFVKTNYPCAWVGHYLIQRFLEADPVIRRGFSCKEPFLWSELDWTTPPARQVQTDAERFSIPLIGYSIPIGYQAGWRGLLSVSVQASERHLKTLISCDSAALLQYAGLIHNYALTAVAAQMPPQSLSRREKQCLAHVAQGHSAAAIAKHLHLSEHTVRDHFKSARQKLECTTITQAVHRANQLGMLADQDASTLKSS